MATFVISFSRDKNKLIPELGNQMVRKHLIHMSLTLLKRLLTIMRIMQKAMLHGKPQKALYANATIFKDVNYTWKKKKLCLEQC